MDMGTIAQRVGRTFLSGALAVTLALPAVGALGVQEADAAAGFPDWDVQAGVWYVPYIEWAVDNGVVNGYPDGTFAPDQNVTRGQLAIMLARAAGVNVDSEKPVWNATPFSDNLGGQYYTKAVNWAYEYGILTGFEGKVRPDDSVTRQEAAAMLGRFAQNFLNLDISSEGMSWPVGTTGQESVQGYAVDNWLWLANKGVLQGSDLGNGEFALDPEGNFTRAQTAKVVTVLIRDVLPTMGEIEHKTPARIEFKDVTATGFTAVAYDTYGRDISDRCEFTIDPYGYWQKSPVFTGMQPDTWYTVYARMSATATEPATGAYATGVKTAEASEPQPGDEQGTVWVQEYELVSRNYTQWVGIGVNTPYGMDMAFYSDDLVGNVSNTPEVMRVQNAFQEYYQEMKNTSLSPNEGSDRLTGTVNRQESFLVEAGGHFETYTNAEEKAELYAYGNSAIDPDRLRVTGYDNAAYFLYTMSDGAQIKTKKAAWEYLDTHSGVKILDGSLESEVLRDGYLYSQTPEDMVTAAGGNPNQPWCLVGQKILG